MSRFLLRWEGSGNVAALDVLRAMLREPATVEAYFAEVGLAAGANRVLDKSVHELKDSLASVAERDARRVAERFAVILQASLLVRHAPVAVADAFCASRLGDDHGGAYGTLPASADLAAIIERAGWGTVSL